MLAVTLLCQVLLATAAFAIPTSKDRFAQRTARRAAGIAHQSQPKALSEGVHQVDNLITNTSHVDYSSNWAGAVLVASKVSSALLPEYDERVELTVSLSPRLHTRLSLQPSRSRPPRSLPVALERTPRPLGWALTVTPAAPPSSRPVSTSPSPDRASATMVCVPRAVFHVTSTDH